jgi:hypothetical protein
MAIPRVMLPKDDAQGLNIPDMVKMARFSHNPSSFYQALMVGCLETRIRYRSQPNCIKELTSNWDKQLNLAKEFGAARKIDTSQLSLMDELLWNLRNAPKTAQALQWLSQYFNGSNAQLNYIAEFTMKLIICSMIYGRDRLPNLILNEQALGSNDYEVILSAIVTSFGIRIIVHEWKGTGCEATIYSRQSIGNFVYLYMFKYNDMFALLYHQKMLDQETNPNFAEQQLLEPPFMYLGASLRPFRPVAHPPNSLAPAAQPRPIGPPNPAFLANPVNLPPRMQQPAGMPAASKPNIINPQNVPPGAIGNFSTTPLVPVVSPVPILPGNRNIPPGNWNPNYSTVPDILPNLASPDAGKSKVSPNYRPPIGPMLKKTDSASPLKDCSPYTNNSPKEDFISTPQGGGLAWIINPATPQSIEPKNFVKPTEEETKLIMQGKQVREVIDLEPKKVDLQGTTETIESLPIKNWKQIGNIELFKKIQTNTKHVEVYKAEIHYNNKFISVAVKCNYRLCSVRELETRPSIWL